MNGWRINAALRPGNYHSHNPENVDFIRESVGYAIELAGSKEVMVVLDAGFDSQEMLELLEESSVKYVVKHNVRRTNPIEWAKIAKEH
ncbi:MAG: IS1380 family transposase, partial [Deltaproteobacteria bacterium]|nr:IS1380 family transposase [Deltaproteobacteria bacterium]